MYDHVVRPELVGEGIVLGAGSVGPEHVLEQQLPGVVRSQPIKLETRPVDDDLT